MTNLITLTIPNDDHVALRAFGKALEEMALAHGASPTQLQVVNEITMTGEQSEALRERLKDVLGEPEVDTTAQQVESLAQCIKDNVFSKLNDHGQKIPHSDEAWPLVKRHAEEWVINHDSSGTPWDERIHSASKALNSDGTWRLRRKPKDMDEAEWVYFVDEVKAKLTGVTETPLEAHETDDFVVSVASAPHDVDPDTIPKEEFKEVTGFIEPPVTPPGDDFHTDAGVVTEQSVAGIPPIPVPPPVVVPPVPVSDEQAYDFPALMKFLTERHGRITVEQVNALLAVDGLAALTDLNAHPDKIGPFVARVKAHLGE